MGTLPPHERGAGRPSAVVVPRRTSERVSGGTSRDSGPPPNTARYNDWRAVAVAPPDFTPQLAVSVVIPAHRPPAAALARTLAALERQTYPRRLFEVVVVDDGSDPPVALPQEPPFACRIVRQPRRGFGLARARNTGARAASRPILLFLDCDVLVESSWIAAHARWHHAVSDAVSVARVADVPLDGPLGELDADAVRARSGAFADLLSAGGGATPRPGEGHLLRTGGLTSRADDPYRALLGGNFGIGRAFYESLGGHDESFTRWGMEEIEFGYRAYLRGALFAPVPEASAWHQGVKTAERREEDEASLRLQRAKCAHLIAHRGMRERRPGRVFSVPQLVVTIPAAAALRAGGGPDALFRAVLALLADRFHDLVVRLEIPPGDSSAEAPPEDALRESFGPDPRVFFSSGGSALDDFPASPFHLRLPPAAVERGFRPDLALRLMKRLGDAVTARAALPDGTAVTLTRTFALHRARRAGGTPADYGDAKELPAAALGLRRARPRAPARRRRSSYPADYPRPLARLVGRVREIRGIAGVGLFVRWGLAAAGRTLGERARRAEPEFRAERGAGGLRTDHGGGP